MKAIEASLPSEFFISKHAPKDKKKKLLRASPFALTKLRKCLAYRKQKWQHWSDIQFIESENV